MAKNCGRKVVVTTHRLVLLLQCSCRWVHLCVCLQRKAPLENCKLCNAPGVITHTLYLLHMVDLIMLALLVAGDLPLRLLPQISNATDLCALPNRVLHRLGKCQARLTHPFVQPPIDCKNPREKLDVETAVGYKRVA